MSYIIGIDLGTSSVKTILINKEGEVLEEVSKDYPIFYGDVGYIEQDIDDWYLQTLNALKELLSKSSYKDNIEGISFSGQMHGLVLIDEKNNPLRKAILWNDTRTIHQTQMIKEKMGENILSITNNLVLDGFTLPKLLWVKENEPDVYSNIYKFMLPKDYIKFKFTGVISTDPSDAAGTLMYDVHNNVWSETILKEFNVDKKIFPEITESTELVGYVLPELGRELGLTKSVKVFTGAADNACGAIGAGVIKEQTTMCSIGTSGVVLSFEETSDKDYAGILHYFNHTKKGKYYSMGVTLSAGNSLNWFKENIAQKDSIEELVEQINNIPIGSEGLIFTPFLTGERTPYFDPKIRASFLGVDSRHSIDHFVRAMIEGITFSLRESLDILRKQGKIVDNITSIGGGAKNNSWLQIQADIFDAKILKFKNDQGPAYGAAMIAAVGSSWFKSLEESASRFLKIDKVYYPNANNVKKYNDLYIIYKKVYSSTKEINEMLYKFR